MRADMAKVILQRETKLKIKYTTYKATALKP